MPDETASVVIATCNRGAIVVEALASIAAGGRKPLEAVVVDQSDGDATARAVEGFAARGREALGFDVRVLRQASKGAARARNLGWREARGTIVAFTDDDATVAPGWLAALVESLSAPGFRPGIAGGRIVPVYRERNPGFAIPERWIPLLPAYDQGDAAGRYEGDGLPITVNCAARRGLLAALGGFDERIGPCDGRAIQILGEDADLSRRARAAGFDLLYDPRATVFHPVPLSRQTREFLRRRLFVEGASNAWLDLAGRRFRRLAAAAAIVRLARRTLRLRLGAARHDPAVVEGRLAKAYGALHTLLKVGILGYGIDRPTPRLDRLLLARIAPDRGAGGP